MRSRDDKIGIMRDDKIPAALLKLGLPAIMGMMINALYNVVDAYFVGGLGTSQMGAVSVVFPIVQIVIGIGMTFGTGAAMCISRQLGRSDWDQANRTASTALFGSLISGALSMVVALISLDKILLMLGATETILPYARAYALIYLSGCVLHVFSIAMNNIVISEGAARMTMFAMLLGGGLNAVLDPVFIYTFDWGVRGAAMATVASQLAVSLVYVWYILARRGCLRISPGLFTPKAEICLVVLKLGVPVLVFQLLSGAAMGLTYTAASRYGDSAVAAMGIVTRVLALASYVVFGYVKGFQPVAGYNYGAENYRRLSEAIATSLRWVVSYCAIVTTILLVFPAAIMRLFTANDTVLVELGIRALRANAYTLILFGAVMVYSTLFLALGRAREGFLLNIARQGIFFIPAILLLPGLFGMNGVVYSQPVADLLSFSLTMILAIPLRKELRALRRNESPDEL